MGSYNTGLIHILFPIKMGFVPFKHVAPYLVIWCFRQSVFIDIRTVGNHWLTGSQALAYGQATSSFPGLKIIKIP